MSDNHTISILFVCMGNICRSPTGEGVFKYYVEKQGDAERILIDSAGIMSYHSGDPADPRMRTAAARRNYRLDSIARQVNQADIERFDVIIAMDRDNLAELERLAGGPCPHIRLLGSFLPGADGNQNAPDVPDPYYGGDQGFEEVIDMIEAACPALLDHCQEMLDGK